MKFTGQLRTNEVYAALVNMIISQRVFTDNIKGTNSDLVDRFRVDGSMFGDTKLYYATDTNHSNPWGQGAAKGTNKGEEAYANVLEIKRPKDPEVQAITITTFRQVWVTIDYYMTKRAWSDEFAFSQFTSVQIGWLAETKRVYDSTTFNSFIGTHETAIGKQQVTVKLPVATGNLEADNRIEAQTISTTIADLEVELTDPSRNYNDYGFLRSIDKSQLVIAWNSAYANKITKLDTPTIFHDIGIKDLMTYKLPSKYFGKPIGEEVTVTDLNKGKYRLLQEIGEDTEFGSGGNTVVIHPGFAGEELNATVTGNGTNGLQDYLYEEDPSIICKVLHEDSAPYMSAFEVGTSFFNPRSLTENQYLTWGHSDLDHIKNYPFITLRANRAEAAKLLKK